MLTKLTTKFFRKLTDRSFEFGPGLQVVRGANEEGKSTMLEAIGYLIGGVKACRDPLEKVVTWGQPAKALKVEGWFVFDGVEYHAKRSKGGAELTYGDQKVTGQSEVTAFFGRLFGAESDMLGRLMVASQGAIRGALGEKGGKPAIELIERLANFDIIDYVIELVQSNRVTGPTATAEDRVARAEGAVTAAKVDVTPLDVTASQEALGVMRAQLAGAVAAVDGQLKPAYDAAKAAHDAALASQAKGAALGIQINRAIAQRAVYEDQQVAALTASAQRPRTELFTALEAELTAANAAARRAAAYEKVQLYGRSYPAAFWDEGAAELQAALAAVAATVVAYQGDLVAIDTEIRTLKAQLSKGGTTCGACGQAMPDAAAIERHNAEVNDKLLGLHGRRPGVATALQAAEAEYHALTAVQKSGSDYELLAAEMGELVTVDRSNVPCHVKWIGDAPSAGRDVSVINADIGNHKRAVQIADNAKAKAELLAQQDAELLVEIERLRGEMAQCESLDGLAIAQMEFDRVNEKYQEKFAQVNVLRYDIEKLANELTVASTRYEQQMNRVASAEQEVQRAQADLKALEFNNALLKRIRLARPIIADKLWTVVLAAVSSYFSAMRGIKSVVTRSGNEFLVDGEVVGGGSLSGSALDLLGLSIRLALTKTFLPNASMLILDEPAAAMDGNRTQATLGFLVAAGFQQTLLVTHDEDSETVAQGVITI